MEWNEYQHAQIVADFYSVLTARWGEAGRRSFIQAARTYGEQRGKRMAMRAIRDGRGTGFLEYFAYGEYESTDAFFDVTMWGGEGVVHEEVTRCPWADRFAALGLKACGEDYCREIDKAVVRGFDPTLDIETASTQHNSPCCRFYFRQAGIPADTLERAGALTDGRTGLTLPLSYHCAHVFHAFAVTAEGTFGAEGKGAVEEVKERFASLYGRPAMEALARWAAEIPFDTIIDKWEENAV